MKIGLIDVDNTGFPNLALMKLSKMSKNYGHSVEWYTPFDFYDCVYVSKVFTFTPDHGYLLNANTDAYFSGGTGYKDGCLMPEDAEILQPDYSIYNVPKDVAYGFLTRGCPNHCNWCIVPTKEGGIRPYNDIEEIAIEGRKKIVLMDNNILAAGNYAREQLVKIIKKGYRVDFNQALDARLVDDDFAELLAQIKWLSVIRFGCDTRSQIESCEKAIAKIRKFGYKGRFMLYTILYGDIYDCLSRIKYWRADKDVSCFAQPFRDFENNNVIPQWQKDMSRWCNIVSIFRTVDFENYQPRKGFFCKKHLENNEFLKMSDN